MKRRDERQFVLNKITGLQDGQNYIKGWPKAFYEVQRDFLRKFIIASQNIWVIAFEARLHLEIPDER